jgi:formylglycine-generating enzyme required for sulfatase activity
MTDIKSDRIAVAQRGKIFRLCGGSCLVKPELCRSSFRGGPYEADLGSHDFGARLVMFIE